MAIHQCKECPDYRGTDNGYRLLAKSVRVCDSCAAHLYGVNNPKLSIEEIRKLLGH